MIFDHMKWNERLIVDSKFIDIIDIMDDTKWESIKVKDGLSSLLLLLL